MAETGIVQRNAELGHSHVAVYTIEGDTLRVSYLGVHPTKSADIGGAEPQVLARRMLDEFCNEAWAIRPPTKYEPPPSTPYGIT